MQVINFANPISPAQRSWVQEGGNFLLVALSLLPTPPTPRDTRLFEILDFRTNSRVPVSRVGRGGFISKRATIIRFQSIRLIGSFSLNSTPVHRFPPIEISVATPLRSDFMQLKMQFGREKEEDTILSPKRINCY